MISLWKERQGLCPLTPLKPFLKKGFENPQNLDRKYKKGFRARSEAFGFIVAEFVKLQFIDVFDILS